MRLFIAIALLVIVAPAARSEDAKPNANSPVVKEAVTLKPGQPGSPHMPRYSPKGRQLTLTPTDLSGVQGFDHLGTRVQLGPHADKNEGQLVVIARSAPGKPYDLLFVDAKRDGKLNEKPIVSQTKIIRDKIWSSFEAKLTVNHAKAGQPPEYDDYPVSLWAVVEKNGDTPDVLRMSRRGYFTGEVKLGDGVYDLVLSDSDNDGVFGVGDWWELHPRTAGKSAGMRTVGDYSWAGGKAWKLELEGSNGRKVKIVSFDPGCTEEEDVIKRDWMREDRMAKRADKPVLFHKDVDAVLKEVAEKKAAYFIKFETDWCIPCKQMTELVFTAKDVVDAASGLTCVMVDGDARKDLAEKHHVNGYPTGILFDADGKEIARYVGYQSVKETAVFFKKLKK